MDAVHLLFFALAAFSAGAIDAIAGGGGLIQLPALLVGLPNEPVATVLGTNKLSSVFGTSSAAVTYARGRRLDFKLALPMTLFAAGGSALGALLATSIPSNVFKPVILAFLVVVAIYTFKRPEFGVNESLKFSRQRALIFGCGIGLLIGLYDGAIGPGTGSFLVFALVGFLGYEFLRASAIAKVVNVGTNVAAILVFGIHGSMIVWLGLTMAVFNIAGALVGARVAIKGGSRLVRRIFLVVLLILMVRLTWDIF